jgi:sporulation protein YlmC with PRC-barrel domain
MQNESAILTYMLQLSAALLNQPILSLRSGGVIATTTSPIVNPNNFKVEGFYCADIRSNETLILLPQDIRDTIPTGFVVNDYDVLAEPEELVRLHKIMEIGFELLGKQVVTTGKHRVGKVSDYATEMETMYIQKIYVSQSLIKSFTGGSLGIDRGQIHEVTPKKIIIHDLLKTSPATAPAGA